MLWRDTAKIALNINHDIVSALGKFHLKRYFERYGVRLARRDSLFTYEYIF